MHDRCRHRVTQRGDARALLLWPALLALAVLVAWAVPAHAADRAVCPTGCPYSTIGAALAAAGPGDTIKVAGGHTYAERLVIARAVTLIGGYDGRFSAPHVLPCIIDGSHVGPAVQIATDSGTTVFEGFEVTGGATLTERGGGIGVSAAGGVVVIRQNHVYGNSAARGGGIYARAGNDALVLVADNEVDHNSAPLNAEGESFGGGVEADSDQSGRVIVSGNLIHHNTIAPATEPGKGGGGAIAVDAKDTGTVEVWDNLIADNGGQGGVGQINGAGIYADARGDARVTIGRNHVRGNTGTHGGGIGLLAVGGVPVTLAGNVVTGNTAANGALFVVGPATTFNNIVAGNSSGVWVGVPFGATTSWRSTNDTIANNGAPGVAIAGDTTATLLNAIVWGQSPSFNRDVIATYSDVQGGAPGAGNMDADPLFADPAYRLSATSPVRDQGSAAGVPLDDFEGDRRSPGDGVDLGADEFAPFKRCFPLVVYWTGTITRG